MILIVAVSAVTQAAAALATVSLDPEVIHDRTDVMGYHTVDNREQCRRLCWYRRLCTHHSYNQDGTSADANCLLHAHPLQVQGQLQPHLE